MGVRRSLSSKQKPGRMLHKLEAPARAITSADPDGEVETTQDLRAAGSAGEGWRTKGFDELGIHEKPLDACLYTLWHTSYSVREKVAAERVVQVWTTRPR